MARLLVILAFLIALAAAGLAALIVAPAPTKQTALLAIVAGEKSFALIIVAVLASVLALVGMRPGGRFLAGLTLLVAMGTIVVALMPPAQALRLAGDQRVNLELGRYLRAPLDSQEQGKPKKTVTYATVDGNKLELDVYVGTRASGSTPTRPVVVIHGGGWSSGNKGDNALFSQWLADHGCTVFDIQYRTAPQPNWKSATGDVKCAIGWVKQHSSDAEWNVDPAKVMLLGRSAGGHLALLAAYTAGDPELKPSCDAADTTVESVVSFYGPADLAWGYAHPGNPKVYDGQEKLRGFVGGPPEGATAELYKKLSPTERANPKAPRTFMIHGGRDQFVSKEHVELLGDKLHKVEVRYDSLIIPYAQHSFDFVFGGFSGQIVEASLLRFLEERPR
jgi:acetyl esterase/lipase